MSGTDHFKVIRETITSDREIDEQTFTSVAILAERLGRLKETNKVFSDISFSPDVAQLLRQQQKVAVG